MNTQVGKSIGIALLLAAGLLAALFAMGVFSASGVGAHDTGDHLDALSVSVDGAANSIDFESNMHSYTVDVDRESTTLVVTAEGSGDPTIEPEDADEDTGGHQIDLTGSVVKAITVTADDEDNADPAGVYTINLNYESPTNSTTAGATVRLTLKATIAGAVDDEIVISMPGFGLPSSIDAEDVDINYVDVSDVSVDSDKITIVIPDMTPDTPEATGLTTGVHTIRISNRADITNPTKAGTYGIQIDAKDENDEDGNDGQNVATVIRSISIKPDKGGSGSEITVTGKGFSDGEATIFIDEPRDDDDGTADVDESMYFGMFDSDDTVLGRADIDDGSFTFTTTKVKANATINAFDTDDMVADAGKMFTVTNSISVSPSEISAAETLTISLKDWGETGRITRVTFTGGHRVDIPDEDDEDSTDTMYDNFVSYTDPSDDEDGTLKVMVPSEVSSGKASVKVYVGSSSKGSGEITVTALTLRVSPEMVVPGQQITIQGSGFNRNDCIVSVTVGGISAHSDNDDCDEDIKASSSGNIVVSVFVQSPTDGDAIGDGEKTVVVTTASGRKGEAKVEIPEASLTLDPALSRRGSTVTVNAAGFPAGDLVQIKYGGTDGRTVAAATTDASGAASLFFDVPSTATIGEETDVAAVSVGNYAEVTATAGHSTPGATVEVDPAQVVSGGSMTITGTNLPAQVAVAVMEINGIDVRPVPAPATGANGGFEATVLVPQLELGNQRVTIRVAESTPTTFVEVVEATAAVVTAPAEVFGGLGDRLVRVWYLERSTQVWSFYDPDPDVAAFNTLTEVSSGQNVSIIISAGANIGFQDKTLYPGTNPIALK